MKPRKPVKPRRATPAPTDALSCLSATAIARIWKVTAQAVGLWHKAGCPRNDNGTYTLADVIQWREKQASGSKTEEDWKTEGEKWRALNHKLRLMMAEGKVVPLPEVAAFWAERVTVARSSLQSIGQALAPACVGQDVQTVRDLIDGRLRAICDDLAREFEATLEEDQRDDGGSEGLAMAPEAVAE